MHTNTESHWNALAANVRAELYQPVIVEIGNQDDIIQSVRAAQLSDRDTSPALVLQLRLFSEIMFKHKKICYLPQC